MTGDPNAILNDHISSRQFSLLAPAINIYWCIKMRVCVRIFQNSQVLWPSFGKAGRLKSILQRSTTQRSPKLRTSPQPRWNFISPASICGQFPANRFAGFIWDFVHAYTSENRASVMESECVTTEAVWAFTHEWKRSPAEPKEWAQKGWQNVRSWVESRVDCRNCWRLPEKKTRIRGETFEGKKRGGNRGNREVVTAGRESRKVREWVGKEWKRKNSLIKVWSTRNSTWALKKSSIRAGRGGGKDKDRKGEIEVKKSREHGVIFVN